MIQTGISVRARLSQSVKFFRRHQELFTLCLVFGVTRLFMSVFTQLTFVPYGPGAYDFIKQGQYTIDGAYPFINYWSEYPPVFPWLTVAAYRLSLLLPRWDDILTWFGTMLRLTVVPFEVGILVLVYALSARCNTEEDRLRSVFMFATAFLTLFVPLGWFDALPLFWVLLAVYLIVRDQPRLTGLAVGLGMLTKPLTPLVLPAAWQRLTNWRAKASLIAVSVAAFVIAMLPFIILNPAMVLAHWQLLLGHPSTETVWALLDGYYGYGVVPPLLQHFDPSTAGWQNHPGGGYTLWVTLAFGLLGLYLWTRRIDWRDARRTVAFVGLTWSLFVLWSKAYSPQWAITFIPFIALLMPSFRGAVYLFLVAVGLLGEWPVGFVLLGGQPGFLAAIFIWRTALFVLLAFEFGVIALRGRATPRWYRAFWAAIGVFVVSAGFLGNDAFARYTRLQLANEPLRDTILLLQKEVAPQTGLICRDVSVCERIAPFIPGLASFWLPKGPGWQSDSLPAFAKSHPVLWLIDKEDLWAERYLSERYSKETQIWVGDTHTRLARFVALDQGPEQAAQATFGCCLQLESYALRHEGRYLSLKLNWQAVAPVDVSYKVFVHVYNLAGELVAQNDQYPAGEFSPTNQWSVGQTVTDLHGLILSEAAEPGYQLRIGWYDPGSGQRLPLPGSTQDELQIAIH